MYIETISQHRNFDAYVTGSYSMYCGYKLFTYTTGHVMGIFF